MTGPGSNSTLTRSSRAVRKMNLCIVFSVLYFIGYSGGVRVDQPSKIELENSEDTKEDVDSSRVLMNDESPTFFDRFLEALKFKRSRNNACSDSDISPAASETKEQVTDEDWLTTVVKDFDKFITALGEDGDLGLEEGATESGTKTDFKKSALKEYKSTRAGREVKKKNNKNSRGHKMAVELGNRLRTKRNVIGTNKAGLVFMPNKSKSKKGTNRAEIVPLKVKRETRESRIKQRDGTNKAGLVSLLKQDQSKAGSNRVELVLDEMSKSDQNILSSLLSRKNKMKEEDPKFSLVHRRQITMQTDNPKLIEAIEKKVAPIDQVHSVRQSESNNGAINSEHHAPSVPFLSSGVESPGSESPISSLSSKIPGIPSNTAPSGGGENTPTAVIGGFSMMLMPMPGMSLSNIQNMFQNAQQFSQLLPALPSVPS